MEAFEDVVEKCMFCGDSGKNICEKSTHLWRLLFNDIFEKKKAFVETQYELFVKK